VYAFTGIMAALLYRERGGEGQKVAVDQLLSLLATQCSQIARESDPDEWNGAVVAASDPPDHPFATADLPVFTGIPVARPDADWRRFLTNIGLPELAGDARFAEAKARQANRRALVAALEKRFAELPSAQILPEMHTMGANAVLCHNFATLFEDPQLQAMGTVVQVQHPTAGALQGIDLAFDLTGTPHEITLPPPLLGQHTQEVLADLQAAARRGQIVSSSATGS